MSVGRSTCARRACFAAAGGLPSSQLTEELIEDVRHRASLGPDRDE
jgi:hypothetical protein